MVSRTGEPSAQSWNSYDMNQTIQKLAAPGVQALRPYTPGKPLSELEREYGIRNAVKLASNENPLGPSPRVLQALQAEFPDLARYPDGNGFALKAELAQRLGVAAQNITLGNGSNDVLELVARAFLTPRSAAVFSAHAFAVYPIVTQAIGARANVAAARFFEANQLPILYRVHEGPTEEKLEALRKFLGELGLENNTAVVLTSDHGESLGEEGRAGHGSLAPAELLVPLVELSPYVRHLLTQLLVVGACLR